MPWQDEYKKQEKTQTTAADKLNASVQEIIDRNLATATKDVESQKAALPGQFRDNYDAVEVQRIVNQRNVLNRMANAGITNSGLDDSTRAAIDISAGNQHANITSQQEDAYQKLVQALTQINATAENERTARSSDIYGELSANLSNTRQSLYNNYVTTEAQKAAAIAQAGAAKEKARQDAIVAQAKIDQQNQSDLIKRRMDLLTNHSTGKITDEQYNATAPLLGLAQLSVPAQTGASGTSYQSSFGPKMRATDYGAKLKSDMQSNKIIDYEAVNYIFNEYPNDEAAQMQAAMAAGVFNEYSQRIKPAANPVAQTSNNPVRDFKTRQIM